VHESKDAGACICQPDSLPLLFTLTVFGKTSCAALGARTPRMIYPIADKWAQGPPIS
jgi:hypothetical protein